MEVKRVWNNGGTCGGGLKKGMVSSKRAMFVLSMPFLGLVALILSIVCQPISAAYFYVQESQDKCFMENVPLGVALTASYKNHENPGVTCSIIFKDPTGRSVYSREVLPADTEGKVTHMTATAGEYQVCISCASSKWFSAQLLKWSISIELGDTDINIEELAKKDHVNTLHLKLQAIARRVDAMQAENDYERIQEERFQRTSESINSRVVWFSVLQLLVLCACTLVSIFYLVRYFHSHRII